MAPQIDYKGYTATKITEVSFKFHSPPPPHTHTHTCTPLSAVWIWVVLSLLILVLFLKKNILIDDASHRIYGGINGIITPEKFSHCCESSRSHTNFPTYGSSKGTENPQGIWLWSSAGFEYITSTGLGEQRLLEGTNKNLRAPGPRRKEQWSQKRMSQTLMWVFGSLWWKHGLTVACSRVRDTESSSPGRCSMLV